MRRACRCAWAPNRCPWFTAARGANRPPARRNWSTLSKRASNSSGSRSRWKFWAIPDLVVANTNSNNLGVLLGNGDGTFQAAVNYAAGGAPVGIAAVDMNGDGNLDLIATVDGGNDLIVLPGNGNGTFQARVVYPVGSKPLPLAVADFNRDGRTDIAAANSGANSVSVLLGSTATTSTTLTSSANPAKAGKAVTFKAVVQIGGTTFATPGGTVTFADGGNVLPGGMEIGRASCRER